MERAAFIAPPRAQIAAAVAGLLVFVFLISFSVSRYFAFLPLPGSSPTAFGRQLDASVPEILRHFKTPGMVVSVVVGGAPYKTWAYGWADEGRREPMRPDTVFRVSSLSKSVTAWGVLRLAQDGRLDLDAPASRYLRRWPIAPSAWPADGVTVRRLLNHTSGLNAGDDSFGDPDAPPPSALALLDRLGPGLAAAPGPARLTTAPGTTYVYSVAGYTLLQALTEHLTGQPFGAFMDTAVLAPLGMASSSFRWREDLRDRTATPYDERGRKLAMTTPRDAAADSLYSTGPDLARFLGAPLPDRRLGSGAGVLRADSVRELYDAPSDAAVWHMASLGPDRPGLGHFIEVADDGRRIVTNGGYDPGWSSQFFISPDTGDGVVILTNSDRGAAAIAQVASIWAAWRGLPPSAMTAGFRALGLSATVLLSLLTTFAVGRAICLTEGLIPGGARRREAGRPEAMAMALDLAVVVAMLTFQRIGRDVISQMPTLHATQTAIFIAAGLVLGASLLAPVRRTGDAPRTLRALEA